MTRSAPSEAHRAAFSGPPATAMTRAPAALPNWMPARAQTAGRRVHDERLTGLQPSALEQRQVGGLEREQEGGGLGVVELGGSVEDRDGVGDRVLGDATERVLGDGDHPLAQPRLGALAHLVDHAAHVHAERERRRGRHRDEVPPTAVDVVEVQRGRAPPRPGPRSVPARGARRSAPPGPLRVARGGSPAVPSSLPRGSPSGLSTAHVKVLTTSPPGSVCSVALGFRTITTAGSSRVSTATASGR